VAELKAIDVAARLDDLSIPTGNRLEKLRGDQAGRHSIRVNDRCRATFRWEEGDAHEVRGAAAERRCGPLGGWRRAPSWPPQFASAAFFADSVSALAASARVPAPISFTSIVTLRILPVNLLS
jgi:hypothetical protein